jgi:hypothetical protein
MFDVLYYMFWAFVAFFIGGFIYGAFIMAKDTLDELKFSKDKGIFKNIIEAISALWKDGHLLFMGIILVIILFFFGLFIFDWDSGGSGGFCNYVNGEKQCYTDKEIQQMIP